MDIRKLLNDMAVEMGLNQLALDRNNSCALVFDDALQVDMHYSESDRVLHVGSVIGAILATEKPALMRSLLAANADPSVLGEAHFALDLVRGEVLLCRTLAAHELRDDNLSGEMLKFVMACKDRRAALAGQRLIVIEAL